MLSVFTLSGCSDDFLDLTPPTDTVGEYFNTQEHVEEALVAAYNPLQWPDWGNNYYCPINLMSDIMADDIWVGGSSKTDNQFWHLMMNFEALPNQTPAGLWTDEYSGVKRANDVLSYINDSRDELSQDFIDKASGGTVLPRLISPNQWVDGTAGVAGGWGFCPVRTETYERYAGNDTRRDATCFNAAVNGEYNKRYQDTGLFLAKYIATPDGNAGQKADADLNFNNNLRVYRYAECLLNAAELILKTGGDQAEALRYVNQVRQRAHIATLESVSEDIIIRERQLEFVGEGKRYWDLVRTGKAPQVLVPDEYGYRTNTWSESKKYLPIPDTEMSSDPNLKQNDY